MKIIIYFIPLLLGSILFSESTLSTDSGHFRIVNHVINSNLLVGDSADNSVTDIAKKVFKNTAFHKISRDLNGQIKATVGDIAVADDLLFYKLRILNRSNINFDIDFIRFSVRDLKVAKRTVTQERELIPIQSYGMFDKTVEGNTREQLVFALEKFPITNGQALFVEIYEKKGGRYLNLKIKRRDIEDARKVR